MKQKKITIILLSLIITGLLAAIVIPNFYILFRHPVKGPTPEKIRDHLLIVTSWITDQYHAKGAYPKDLSQECKEILDKLPYKWEWNFYNDRDAWLTIGSWQWPIPLYGYHWNLKNGWHWSSDDHNLSEEEIHEILVRNGYYKNVDN